MRFHVEGEKAELYEQVLGGPFHFKIEEATELDWGINCKCVVQEGKFIGKAVNHTIAADPSDGAAPYVIQFLDAVEYPEGSTGDLDIEPETLIGLEFVAKARKQKSNPDFSQLFNFQSVSEVNAASLRP